MAEPYYATADELRAALGLTAGQFDDASAIPLIQTAEDVIDSKLGGWPVDRTTGRKIVQPGTPVTDAWPHERVLPWQWAKLKRATLALAVLMRSTPKLFEARQWGTISGPDFSASNPIQTPSLPSEVLAPLNASKLRRPMGRAVT